MMEVIGLLKKPTHKHLQHSVNENTAFSSDWSYIECGFPAREAENTWEENSLFCAQKVSAEVSILSP